MSSETKIAVYSLAELKNTADDALPNYLTSIGFSQSQLLSNLRLGLQGVMVALGAGTFYLDWTRDWSETKEFTFWAVGVYSVLSVIVSCIIWFLERGLIFEGTYKGTTLTIRTHVNKYEPTYYVTFTTRSSSRTVRTTPLTNVSTPFSNFFTSDGHFTAPPFQSWLANAIPVVGTADPARAKQSPDQAAQIAVESFSTGAEIEGELPSKRKPTKA